MGAAIYIAGGFALASAFLLWRLMAAHRKIGKLKADNGTLATSLKTLATASELSRERIRDLTGIDADRLRIAEDGSIWAE